MVKTIQASPDAPWKQRYRAWSIFDAVIAPQNPECGLVYTDRSGTKQFYRWNVRTGELAPLTRTPGGHVLPAFLSPDGRWVYTLKDEQGSEIGHYVRMPYMGGEPEDITPDFPPYLSFTFSLSRCGNRLGFMAADNAGFTIYLMNVSPGGCLGEPYPLYHSERFCFGPILSANGDTGMVMASDPSGENTFCLLAFDALTGERTAELEEVEWSSISTQIPSPLPGDPRVLTTSNHTGIETVRLWNPSTNERTDLSLEGMAGAQIALDWSPDGAWVLIKNLYQAEQKLYLHHLPTRKTVQLEAPAGVHRPYFTPDGKGIYSLWTDAAHNPRLVALDPNSGALIHPVLEAGAAPEGHPWKSIGFISSDGQAIQGWLSLPEGEGPFPAILAVHGGPAAVQENSFSPEAQAWVDHGFAFLSINYRGSVTFGREFERKILGDLGHWEVEDLAAAHGWLVNTGIAHPDAVFLTGWSYGGYLTLLGLGKHPGLWAGGMAGIAIVDWAIQWENHPGPARGYLEGLVGGTPQGQPERYRLSSALTYAAGVQAPLLIIQGRNDSRTPAYPVEIYEAKMRALGKDIKVHWYDTGHAGAFGSVDASIAHQEMMMCFAQDHLSPLPAPGKGG